MFNEDSSEQDALVAIDERTASQVWRRDLPTRCHPVAVYATGIALCRGDRQAGDVGFYDPEPNYAIVIHFDPATGALGWQRVLDDAIAFAVDADHVVAARPGALAIFDARSGSARELAISNTRAIARVDACGGDPAGTVVSVGDSAAPVGSDGRFAIRVHARGALLVGATGRLRWPATSIRLVGHHDYDAGVLVPRCPKA
jgi:PQQ-like domain